MNLINLQAEAVVEEATDTTDTTGTDKDAAAITGDTGTEVDTVTEDPDRNVMDAGADAGPRRATSMSSVTRRGRIVTG